MTTADEGSSTGRPPVAEKHLQAWFNQVARSTSLAAVIRNHDELYQLQSDMHELATRIPAKRVAAIDNAVTLLQSAVKSSLLSATKSIANTKSTDWSTADTAMSPDAVLLTPQGRYILVELKTKMNTEREAVQELMAYSLAIQLQTPLVDDIGFIVIAQHWGTLLRRGVQAMMLEGKAVLPLAWYEAGEGEFALRIHVDLFNFQFERRYDPWYALNYATLARMAPQRQGANCLALLQRVRSRLLARCAALGQSGFVLLTSNWAPDDHVLYSLTFFVVNPFWQQSDFLPESAQIRSWQQHPRGVLTKHHNAVRDAYQQVTPVPPEEVFWVSEAQEHAMAVRRELFPDENPAYDLLWPVYAQADASMLNPKCGWEIEPGATLSLYQQYVEMQGLADMHIVSFSPFGELAELPNRDPYQVRTYADMTQFLENYRRYKLP